MAKTGAHVNALRTVMQQLGRQETARKPASPRLGSLPAATAGQVMDLYRALGGIQDAPKLAPGSWDVVYSDGLLIELDEGMRFNRYRGTTLDAPWAITLPWTAPYRQYVVDGEQRAGTGGKRWTNPSAERMFGEADLDGVIGVHGAPRWKQRAMYDAIKDAAAAAGQVQLARVSIYDLVDGHLLNEVLYGRVTVDAAAVEDLVVRRTTRDDIPLI
jgi:hypothetical protein